MFNKIAFLLCLITSVTSAQEIIKGKVFDKSKQPISGATVIWQNTALATSTNANGDFAIEKSSESTILIISFEGFETQKIAVNSTESFTIILKEVENLKEVTISKTKKKAPSILCIKSPTCKPWDKKNC